jgi:hypothetical protein
MSYTDETIKTPRNVSPDSRWPMSAPMQFDLHLEGQLPESNDDKFELQFSPSEATHGKGTVSTATSTTSSEIFIVLDSPWANTMKGLSKKNDPVKKRLESSCPFSQSMTSLKLNMPHSSQEKNVACSRSKEGLFSMSSPDLDLFTSFNCFEQPNTDENSNNIPEFDDTSKQGIQRTKSHASKIRCREIEGTFSKSLSTEVTATTKKMVQKNIIRRKEALKSLDGSFSRSMADLANTKPTRPTLKKSVSDRQTNGSLQRTRNHQAIDGAVLKKNSKRESNASRQVLMKKGLERQMSDGLVASRSKSGGNGEPSNYKLEYVLPRSRKETRIVRQTSADDLKGAFSMSVSRLEPNAPETIYRLTGGNPDPDMDNVMTQGLEIDSDTGMSRKRRTKGSGRCIRDTDESQSNAGSATTNYTLEITPPRRIENKKRIRRRSVDQSEDSLFMSMSQKRKTALIMKEYKASEARERSAESSRKGLERQMSDGLVANRSKSRNHSRASNCKLEDLLPCSEKEKDAVRQTSSGYLKGAFSMSVSRLEPNAPETIYRLTGGKNPDTEVDNVMKQGLELDSDKGISRKRQTNSFGRSIRDTDESQSNAGSPTTNYTLEITTPRRIENKKLIRRRSAAQLEDALFMSQKRKSALIVKDYKTGKARERFVESSRRGFTKNASESDLQWCSSREEKSCDLKLRLGRHPTRELVKSSTERSLDASELFGDVSVSESESSQKSSRGIGMPGSRRKLAAPTKKVRDAEEESSSERSLDVSELFGDMSVSESESTQKSCRGTGMSGLRRKIATPTNNVREAEEEVQSMLKSLANSRRHQVWKHKEAVCVKPLRPSPFDDSRLDPIPRIVFHDLWKEKAIHIKNAFIELRNLCRSEDKDANIAALFDVGGYVSLVGAMRKWYANADLQAEGCRALHSAAVGGSDDFAAAAVRCGSFDTVLSAMENFPDDEYLQDSACGALYALTATSSKDASVKLAAQLNGVPMILRAMKAFPESVRLQQRGCLAICSMARWEELQSTLSKSALLIRSAMAKHTDQRDQHTKTLHNRGGWALERLAHKNHPEGGVRPQQPIYFVDI